MASNGSPVGVRARLVLMIAVTSAAAILLAGCKSAPDTLEGTLSVADGSVTAPAGVAVALFSDDTDHPVAQTFTDADGHYAFDADQAPPGAYRLRFGDGSWWSGADSWATATPITAATEPATRIDATIRVPSAELHGTVSRRSGRPLAGATVAILTDGASDPVATTTTAGDGSWSIDGLSVMDVTVRFSADHQATRYHDDAAVADEATPIVLDGSAAVRGIDAVLDPDGRLTGQFAGSPVGWQDVYAVARDTVTGVTGYAPVDAFGNYTITELDAGDYTVGVVDLEGRFALSVVGATTADPSVGTTFSVGAGATTRIAQHTVSGADCPSDSRNGSYAGADFSGANLTGCDFAGAALQDADFTGADLFGASFNAARLPGATFAGARLDGAQFFVTDASNVDFTGSTLDRANFRSAAVTGSVFGGADMAGIRSGQLVGVPADLPPGWAVAAGWFLGPRADLSGADLTGFDLSGRDLRGASLTNTNLSGVDLSASDLRGAGMTGATLDGAILTDADLAGMSVSGAHGRALVGVPAALPSGVAVLHGVWFGPGARVTGADVDGLDLSGVDPTRIVSGALTGTPSALPAGWAFADGFLIGPATTITGADLTGADLSGVSLLSVRSGGLTGEPAALPAGAVLHNGYLVARGASLDRADLSGLDAPGIDLSGTNLMWADLSGADLSGANLTGTHLDVTDLTGADLTGADLTGAILSQAEVTGTDFTDATMIRIYSRSMTGIPAAMPAGRAIVAGAVICPGAEAAYVDFSGADLSGMDLTGAFLAMADFSGADLSGTNLDGADLSGAVLGSSTVAGTRLGGANLDGASGMGLVGTPAVLPDEWIIQAGVLVPPNG